MSRVRSPEPNGSARTSAATLAKHLPHRRPERRFVRAMTRGPATLESSSIELTCYSSGASPASPLTKAASAARLLPPGLVVILAAYLPCSRASPRAAVYIPRRPRMGEPTGSQSCASEWIARAGASEPEAGGSPLPAAHPIKGPPPLGHGERASWPLMRLAHGVGH